MIRKYIIVADDSIKGFDEEIAKLEREWGAEEIEPCEDCISREEVMRILKTLYEFDELKDLKAKQREVMNLPSVTPKPNRCDSCIHSEEQDGSDCYECVKGMADNFEAQPTDADCISRAQALHACCAEWNKDYKAIMKSIRQLPSVTPKVDSKWGLIGKNTDLETVPTNLQDWLSTFNTVSATECFTAVQPLKERVNE